VVKENEDAVARVFAAVLAAGVASLVAALAGVLVGAGAELETVEDWTAVVLGVPVTEGAVVVGAMVALAALCAPNEKELLAPETELGVMEGASPRRPDDAGAFDDVPPKTEPPDLDPKEKAEDGAEEAKENPLPLEEADWLNEKVELVVVTAEEVVESSSLEAKEKADFDASEVLPPKENPAEDKGVEVAAAGLDVLLPKEKVEELPAEEPNEKAEEADEVVAGEALGASVVFVARLNAEDLAGWAAEYGGGGGAA
jgi:hypothetical protein